MGDKKFELVKSMNTIVTALNNEEAYYQHWIYIVPDAPDDEDFRDIAENESLFQDTVDCFKNIMRFYLKDGICINDVLY